MIKLGIKVKDVVTEFTGMVIGRVEYVTGCAQYLVAPKAGADGSFKEAVWLDEVRLERIGEEELVLDGYKVVSEPAGPQRNNPTFNLPT